MEIWKRWIVGLVVSLVVGAVITPLFLCKLRKYIKYNDKILENGKKVPAWVTGTLERLFFVLLVAFDVSATATAMVGWLAVKMATDWQRISEKDMPNVRKNAFSGLLGGMMSLLWALVGGLICKGKIFG